MYWKPVEPSAETSGAVGGIAGGVIVGVAVMVVLLVVCVVIVVVLKRRRSQKSPKKGRDVHNNAISESGTHNLEYGTCLLHDHCSTGTVYIPLVCFHDPYLSVAV